MSLPGVGDYAARAVLCFASDIPFFIREIPGKVCFDSRLVVVPQGFHKDRLGLFEGFNPPGWLSAHKSHHCGFPGSYSVSFPAR